MTGPRVSVVIGAYNCADFIEETIKSVIAQKFTDWELVIVDDGSSDNTCVKIEAVKDSRIRLIRLTGNSGRPAVSRNTGIRASRGEFIAFLDHDDIWMPDKLQKQVAVFDKDKDAYLVYSKCIVKEGDKVTAVSPENPRAGHIFKELFLSYNMFPCSTVMIRNRKDTQPYLFNEDKELAAIEDYDLWLRIAYSKKIAFVAEPLTIYRLHGTNTSKGIFPFFKRVSTVINRYSGWAPKTVLIRKYTSFYYHLCRNCIKYFIDYIKKGSESGK